MEEDGGGDPQGQRSWLHRAAPGLPTRLRPGRGASTTPALSAPSCISMTTSLFTDSWSQLQIIILSTLRSMTEVVRQLNNRRVNLC